VKVSEGWRSPLLHGGLKSKQQLSNLQREKADSGDAKKRTRATERKNKPNWNGGAIKG